MSATSDKIRVQRADWSQFHEQILAIRFEVFVEEQGVPEEEERDQADPTCVHVLAWNDGVPIGTGRLLRDGKIGRMAVLAPWRNHGIGTRLLQTLIAIARSQRPPEIYLDAQVGAIGFYERHGFVAHGPVFKDAGIDHRRMTRSL